MRCAHEMATSAGMQCNMRCWSQRLLATTFFSVLYGYPLARCKASEKSTARHDDICVAFVTGPRRCVAELRAHLDRPLLCGDSMFLVDPILSR
jgi:hypothetical protein